MNLTPLDTMTQFFTAMNQCNLEAALNLYEPSASFVKQPGMVVSGKAALREALAGFMALKPVLASEAHQIVESGDLALYCIRWSLQGTDAEGKSMQMNGCSSDVLRRQADGNWLIAVDNPWGTDIVA